MTDDIHPKAKAAFENYKTGRKRRDKLKTKLAKADAKLKGKRKTTPKRDTKS